MFRPIEVDPDFLRLLAPLDGDWVAPGPGISQGQDTGTTYGLWPDLRLAAYDEAWLKFSQDNGGEPMTSTQWTVGRCILEAIADPLRPFFSKHYQQCLSEQRPWEHHYECSSADTYREMHMLVLPVGQAEGLVVINSIARSVPHQRASGPVIETLYRDSSGKMTQCCHCRRMRRVDVDTIWEWIPEWVDQQPEATSHGICEPCAEFHYHPDRITSRIETPIRTGI